ncbi:MAG: DUF3267 domain-containing protein [Clostridia bacterium]|nr:DUF3267 domain-containing protein [Clostridia bacterium]
MKAYTELPRGYREIDSIDLQKNKKLSLLVNGVALLIVLVMAIPMHFVVPMTTLFDMSQGYGAYFLRFGVLMAAIVVYMVLHELVHGITMKMCGTKKIKYGFTGVYAFAGSNDYYDKRSYIVIALAPIVVWGVVLLVLNLLVPVQWFWIVYWVQVSNISGAAGDLYVTYRFSRLPQDILVQDYGVGMTVYSAEAGGEQE